VGEQTTVLVGQFVSQGPLTEMVEVPTAIGPQLAAYEAMAHGPVHELWLKPTPSPHEYIR
jgi:hypothetical protein